jgi:transketolase
VEELKAAFAALPFEKGKPSVIIAQTTKGKGVSFMENQLKWHHGVPDKEQYEIAQQELDLALNKV